MMKKAVLVSILFLLGSFSAHYPGQETPMANDFAMKQASMLLQPVKPDAQIPDRETDDFTPRVRPAKEAPIRADVAKETTRVAKAEGTKPPVTGSVQPSTRIPTVITPVKPEEKEKPDPALSAPEPSTIQEPAEPSRYSFKSDMEKEILRLTNEIRAQEGLGILRWDTALHTSARNHTRYMFEENVFRHTTKYKVAENIILLASPQKVETYTAQYLVDKWMASEGHRANILNPDITLMGVGVVRGDQYFSKYDRTLPAIYGTQHFK